MGEEQIQEATLGEGEPEAEPERDVWISLSHTVPNLYWWQHYKPNPDLLNPKDFESDFFGYIRWRLQVSLHGLTWRVIVLGWVVTILLHIPLIWIFYDSIEFWMIILLWGIIIEAIPAASMLIIAAYIRNYLAFSTIEQDNDFEHGLLAKYLARLLAGMAPIMLYFSGLLVILNLIRLTDPLFGSLEGRVEILYPAFVLALWSSGAPSFYPWSKMLDIEAENDGVGFIAVVLLTTGLVVLHVWFFSRFGFSSTVVFSLLLFVGFILLNWNSQQEAAVEREAPL